jgi:hypothetical protein
MLAIICLTTGCDNKKNTSSKHEQEVTTIEKRSPAPENRSINYVWDSTIFLEREISGFLPEEGFVPTPEIAVKIAETILSQIYGEKQIEEQKPFLVKMEDEVWIIHGNDVELRKHYEKFGTVYMEISKRDGKILKVFHGK